MSGAMDKRLHNHIDYWSQKTPDKDAFRINGQGLTYRELDEASDRIAHWLTSRGVGPGAIVGILMNKCLDMPVAVFGILKAGAAYLPLDPSAPLMRIQHMLDDCNVTVLLTEPAQMAKVEAVCQECARLRTVVGAQQLSSDGVDAYPFDIATNAAAPPTAPALDDPCYLIFTSGSTGKPKAMVHSHQSALSYAEMAAEIYALGPDDRMGNHAPLHFDMSTLEFFAGTMRGATVVMIPEAVTKFPASMSQLMADERLTTWYSVPFALIQLAEMGVLGDRDLSALRLIAFAGAPMSPRHLNLLQQALPDVLFSNAYGPAEANAITYYHLPKVPHPADKPIPIGLPCPNADLRIDEDGQLLVASDAAMIGYWKRDELNAQAFVQIDGKRFYQTGDIVTKDPHGVLHYHGRADRQVKIRGHRIELDEVELVISAHEGVSEVAVVPAPDGLTLHAFITKAPEATVTEAELVRLTRQHLPPSAVPSRIEFLNRFRRTSTGKIDLNSLSVVSA